MYRIVPNCLCIACQARCDMAIPADSNGDLFYFHCRRCQQRVYVQVSLYELSLIEALPTGCEIARPWGQFHS